MSDNHITIPEQPRRHAYTVSGTPSKGPFNVNFPFTDDNDIVVYVDGVQETGFSLIEKSSGPDGGFLNAKVLLNETVLNASIVIRDNQTIERLDDFPYTGPFSIRELNTELDRHVMMLLRLKDKIGLALALDENVAFSTSYDALGNTIDNLGAGTTPTSAVTATQVTNQVSALISGATAVASLTNTAQGTNGAAGDGVTGDDDELLAMTTAGTGYLEAGTYLVEESLVLSSTVIFAPGAKLKPASGKVITLDADPVVSYPGQHIFDISAGGDVVFSKPTAVYTHWWGCSPAASATVNSAAIEAAVLSSDKPVINTLPGSYDYDAWPALGLAGGVFEGSGQFPTTFFYTGSDWAMKTQVGAARTKGWHLRNFTVQGKGITITGEDTIDIDASDTALGGILLQLCEQCVVSNVSIIGFVKSGAWTLKLDASNQGGIIGAWRNELHNVAGRAFRNGCWFTGLSGNGQPNDNYAHNVRMIAPSDNGGGGYNSGICFLIDEGDSNSFYRCEADGRDFEDGSDKSSGWIVDNNSGASTTRYNLFDGIRAEECSIGFHATGVAARSNLINPTYLNCDVDEVIDNIEGWTRLGIINGQSSNIAADQIMALNAAMNLYLDADENGSNQVLNIWTGAPVYTMVLTTAADGPSGPFQVGETITDDSDALIKGVISKVTGTAPNVTLRYRLVNRNSNFDATTLTFTGDTSGATASAVNPSGPVKLAEIDGGMTLYNGNLVVEAGNLRVKGNKAIGLDAANYVIASSLGSVVKKMDVYDDAGALVGSVPVYDTIT